MSNDTLTRGGSVRPKEHRENRKKNRGRKVEDNQAMAIAKFIRVPPRKARLVMDEVRGQYVFDALAFLSYIPNRAAGYISKVLSSAMANAQNNHNLDPRNLKLIEARVDEGPRMKRVQPRAQGRAYAILKRTSHITVIVEEVEPKPRKPKKVVATGTRAAAARAARTETVAVPQPVEALEVEETVTPVSEVENTASVSQSVSAETASDKAVETTTETAVDDTTDEIGAPIVGETTTEDTTATKAEEKV